jgi:hypothetical protein
MLAATAILRIEALTAETQSECFGVRLLGKTKHVPPLILVVDGMATRTKRQVATERMQRSILRPPAHRIPQGDLMGPAAIYFAR